MRRIAFFVEGATELLFVRRLFTEVAGAKNVAIECQRITGGSSVPKRILTIQAALADPESKFFVLVVDCGGDRQVATRIREEHQRLTQLGYEMIVGLRDVYPDFVLTDVPKLQAGLRYGIKQSLAPVDFVLATMELEAWFLSESTHFPRIDPALTDTLITTSLGFDPGRDDMTQRPTPASDLNLCYQLVGKSYKKGGNDTIDAIDYGEIYLSQTSRIGQLAKLTTLIESFLAPKLVVTVVS